jgi:hypothetical protein
MLLTTQRQRALHGIASENSVPKLPLKKHKVAH